MIAHFTYSLLFCIGCFFTHFSTYAQCPATPVISSFAPSSGPAGTPVIITGSNFDGSTQSSIVYFGATRAAITEASESSLTVLVPTGATYQPISVTNHCGLTAYSAQPFVTTFSCGGNLNTASLDDRIDYITGLQAYGVAIGDLDGDGKADLAVANVSTLGNGTVSVFRNTSLAGGAIFFAAKVDFPIGNDALDLVIQDMDGDGMLDLVVASTYTVSVLRNISTSGLLSFEARVDLVIESVSPGLAVGDMDKDGKPDLVVTNWDGK